MSAAELLFDMPATPPAVVPLWMHREELAKALGEAVTVAEAIPAGFGDRETVIECLRALAQDGDTEAARAEVRDAMQPPAHAWTETLLEHVNLIGWAFARLRRAELRAVGRGGA